MVKSRSESDDVGILCMKKRIKDLNVNGNLIKFKMHFKLWLNNNNN